MTAYASYSFPSLWIRIFDFTFNKILLILSIFVLVSINDVMILPGEVAVIMESVTAVTGHGGCWGHTIAVVVRSVTVVMDSWTTAVTIVSIRVWNGKESKPGNEQNRFLKHLNCKWGVIGPP